MSAQDRAAELLAELDAKAQKNVADVRARAADIKSRLESGMLNLNSQDGVQAVTSSDDVPPDLNWDLETEAAAEAAPPPEEAAAELEDFRITAPEPVESFKDELDVATDELGIPLGD
jgi:hypothetical protein